MADQRDPQVSQRYRELGAEEPPRALDEAILAASRRAVESRPAPLVAPGGRRRWYFPVAAAAVIMLAVAVTVQVERQKPDEAMVATAPQPRAQEQVLKEQPAAATPNEPARSAPPAAPAPAPAPAPPPAAAPQAADAARDLAKSNEAATAGQGARSDVAEERRAEAAPRSRREAPVAAMAQITPERWLEQIAQLRAQGKHEEADKALAEFRKHYPDYRFTDEMKAKIERK
jgi:hypothetical protein